MAGEKKRAQSPGGTTRSPADRDIFRDNGPPEERDRASESSEAGGVD